VARADRPAQIGPRRSARADRPAQIGSGVRQAVRPTVDKFRVL
jgi:hypothetical protein